MISSGRVLREAAEQRADGEQGDAGHVEALASEAVGEPAGDGQNDGAGDQIAGEDPGGLFLAGAESAGDVRQGDVGDGGVEHLHEGGERDGEGDRPRIVVGLPDGGYRRCGEGRGCHISLLISYQETDMMLRTTTGKDGQAERRRAARMMKRIMIHFRMQMDEKLRPQGVTTAQLQVLKAVQDEPAAFGAQLARVCHVTPQSAQALLKSLEDGGWIVRTKDRVNDRILIARLTPSGVELLETAEKLARVIEKRLWAGVPDSRVTELNKTLTRCLANLDDA